ncbi:hypothetical protein AWJ20_294 [Sugiyamaella lignohabitans]|uniref:D-xylose 1-dehydrogenase (NADP(+), D-xylono-1,5-lactone-forming) n=1 Tax=Sugiyamaella lignohabitans TaxID=796027 RepID=A0A167CSL3_9ASCO|nr:uncharacterized protein AWJ20_294 [Sugiyamaella lignohabitans]ANB12059.1 hypothetical protein AWJ20_294 [Sugiyamaella lignohabitans]
MVYTLKWGILATGGIATTFAKDILADPGLRNVSDVKHEIVAVASSSSAERAKKFAEEVGAPSAAAYGNYEQLVADKNVDVIYVATPHSHHYQNAKLALEAGKNVLCEKPFTINAKQLKHLVKIAREKKLFLMEAVWTRYFPMTLELQKLLFKDRIIGKILRVSSDLAVPFNIPNDFDPKHRMKNPELGGGALLDLGIYSLTWIFITAFAEPENKRQAPKVNGSILFTKDTKVDEHTTVNLIFPESHVSAVATTSMTGLSEHDNVCLIQGEKGYIKVDFPTYRPEGFTINLYQDGIKGSGKNLKTEHKSYPIPGGHGMHWEADEVARCLRDGKLESSLMPLDESIIIAEAMDKVREVNDFKYPAALEAVDQY